MLFETEQFAVSFFRYSSRFYGFSSDKSAQNKLDEFLRYTRSPNVPDILC